MTTVRFRPRKGHPNLVTAKLRADVANYTSDHSIFKIGRTSDPHRRAKQADYADVYKEMVVVYETKVAEHADAVERHLVNAFQHSKNFRGGGGGPRGQPPYYVYVVRQKSFWQGILGFFSSKQEDEESA
jgi:hypothetical protein